MLLIEADGKALLAENGIAIPHGVILTDSAGALPDGGPWIVKAQVPVGGRGHAGGIIRCNSSEDIRSALSTLLGARIKGHAVEACLVEQAVVGQEHYLAVMVDAASYGLRVIYAAHGGVDVEQSGSAAGRLCPPHAGAVVDALSELVREAPEPARRQLMATGKALAEMLLTNELALAEINPLFVNEGICIAGDAKIVIDLNAVHRQPRTAAIIAARPSIYSDACRKIDEGFDYVELDPDGEIGLVTTGAGLSMMLIDELTARGAKPLNFCDIRTGQMRGNPARLVKVLEWLTSRPSLKVVLVNIFAGITDLAEFAGLLAAAIDASPALKVPVVARLVGRNAIEAKRILGLAQPNVLVTEDLEEALARIAAIVGPAR